MGSPFIKVNRQLSTWDQLESSRPLPVRFQLYASRRTNKALCPCLLVRHRNVCVIRILDPEHRQPYISLDSIFILSNRTIPQGILEFDLSREKGDYDLTLAGLEPREALWVPLKLAREIAEQVGLLVPLSTLLDWENRHIWTLDEGDAGLVHNWRALQLDADSYSTGLLIQNELKTVSLLPKSQQVRTLISQEQRQVALLRVPTVFDTVQAQLDTHRNKYEQRLIRWSVLACEELHRSRKDLEERQDGHESDDDDEKEERFRLDSSEILLLFDEFLKSTQAETTFEHVSVDPEEILAGKVSGAPLDLPKDEIYRRARVNVLLIHHIWTMTFLQIASKDNSPATTSTQASLIDTGQAEIKEQIKRLEQISKRSEWGISELLTRKSSGSHSTAENRHMQVQWRLPIIGDVDARIIVALLIGILLGSMTSHIQ